MSPKKPMDPKWEAQITPEITAAVLDRAQDGKLNCPVAWKIADELGVPTMVVGAAANKAEIRIENCNLGCF